MAGGAGDARAGEGLGISRFLLARAAGDTPSTLAGAAPARKPAASDAPSTPPGATPGAAGAGAGAGAGHGASAGGPGAWAASGSEGSGLSVWLGARDARVEWRNTFEKPAPRLLKVASRLLMTDAGRLAPPSRAAPAAAAPAAAPAAPGGPCRVGSDAEGVLRERGPSSHCREPLAAALQRARPRRCTRAREGRTVHCARPRAACTHRAAALGREV